MIPGRDGRPLFRFWVWRSAKTPRPLCVVAAHNADEAVATAKTIFYLDRTAHAEFENPAEEAWAKDGSHS
ncbi:MAG: hypothetical protein EOM25_13115 [Deltaproteobacteria bacterium]|nr:hypothetical protein [Deltaproteobacteria bacterium]